jgi:hypothetical protein
MSSRLAKTDPVDVLPVGVAHNDNLLSTRLQVLGNLYAKSVIFASVTVNEKLAQLSTQDIQVYFRTGISENNCDFDVMKSTITQLSSAINTVNCSSASVPLCATLNRIACLAQTNTCGKCLPDHAG